MDANRVGSRARNAMVLAAVLMFVFSVGIAAAYGTQNHSVNGITHGCPFDPGCTSGGAAGDYNRNGYNLKYPYALLDYSYVAVYDAETGSFKTSQSCGNCIRVDAYWDTNPKRECEFKTYHYVDDTSYSLNGHYHWTSYATSSSGC